jgi:hypothetical protein
MIWHNKSKMTVKQRLWCSERLLPRRAVLWWDTVASTAKMLDIATVYLVSMTARRWGFFDLRLMFGVFHLYLDVVVVVMTMIDDLQRTLYGVFILSNYCRLSLPAAQGSCAYGRSGERVC